MLEELPAIVTLKEMMQILSISKSSALKLLNSGQITGHRIGKQWRIFTADIIEYLEHT